MEKEVFVKRERKKLIRDPELTGFELMPRTAGKICNGVFFNKVTQELIIKFAWGGHLHFKRLDN